MDINNCTTSNIAPGQDSTIISHNSNLPKRFAALISNLESVSNHTDKVSIKDFINFSKNNLEKINSSLMSVSNPQEVEELIQQASRPCRDIKVEFDLGLSNTPYILQEESKLEDSLKSLKDRLQQDIGIETEEEKALSLEQKLRRERDRVFDQADKAGKKIGKQAQDGLKKLKGKMKW
ncbi:hypothetical protein ACL2XO_21170 [Sodalis sp. RH15]|uniref:hypothetical protein n=1 Tax=Sodalis sp. RH15 TaxID=3394330 RepID=UPI0039B57195